MALEDAASCPLPLQSSAGPSSVPRTTEGLTNGVGGGRRRRTGAAQTRLLARQRGHLFYFAASQLLHPGSRRPPSIIPRI
ncbi:hypothetical protein E2562_016148 [Oryza meyeriana var. granulata]|uniref:Uncharacterized protein n=1 Tax=Oryza meyeriana var. granulata TaxID=110450 RepID=A0A6G1F8M0_9ORYZ|nr:hypothetical protein E2562_016148 [Oryza meyeriana var. granulata]